MAVTINGTTSTYWTFKLVVTENSTSVANNTSSVTVEAFIGRGTTAGGSYMWGAKISCHVDITGCSRQTISYNNAGQVNISAGGWLSIGKTTFSAVPHNDDGSKTVTVSASFTNNISPSSGSANGSVTLTTIARASQPSCITWPEHTQNVGEFGDTISIHMNRKSDNFTHTVRYAYGDLSGTIATGVTTGTQWKIPLSFMDKIPNDTSGSGTIYVDTYNGSTKIGTKYCGFTATVPASVKPSVTASLEDTTGVDDIYGSPVAGLSKIKVTPSVTLAYSSPIKTYAITIDGATYASKTVTTGILQNAGSSKVTVTVTDERGRSGSWTYTMNVQAYSRPQVTALAVHRVDEDGTENDQGGWVSVTFSTAVASMNSKNTAAYVLRYKQTTSDTWTSLKLTDLANNFNVMNHAIIFEASPSYSYDVELSATDRHSTNTRSTSASTAFSLMDWHNSGTGLRFGGVAELPNTLQNDLSLKQTGNSYAFQPESFNGAKGYTLLAEIKLNTLNVNAPIIFEINRRGAVSPMCVYVRFASSSTSTDPGLGSITYEGTNYGAFMVKTEVSTWRLYVDNTTGWSNPCLQTWYTTENQKSRLSVSFPSNQVEGTEPSVLRAVSIEGDGGKYYRATPAKLDSLLDHIFPVGFVAILYNHTNPNTLWGGTWRRIENRFLWATTDGGAIGHEGGESTHTLTVNEMPKHSHNVSVSSITSGSLAAQNKIRYSNNATDYNGSIASESSGGGAAHNNMPPYVQVSIWVRES